MKNITAHVSNTIDSKHLENVVFTGTIKECEEYAKEHSPISCIVWYKDGEFNTLVGSVL